MGFLAAWLQAPAAAEGHHKILKETISSLAGLEDRLAGRKYMEDLATAHGGIYQDIVEAEVIARGGSCDEPPDLPVARGLLALEED